MNKEELYIITENGREQLDLPSPSDITLKWVSNLFNDISKLTCSYSYTFKIPTTTKNRRILNLADDIRHESGMVRKAVWAEFYINGICLCPNANLYVSELTDSFSCVMTWKVLKGFEALKSGSGKLTELPSLGKITWGSGETYGGTSDGISNMDAVVYPDYDAGVPHEEGTPPKPCVPVYKLIQMINDVYGVKFNIGKLLDGGMGKKPQGYLNNANFYGKRVYDDYVTNGVLPLVNSQVSNERFAVRGISGIGSHTMKLEYLEYTQKWDVIVFGNGSFANPYFVQHWGIVEGQYTSLHNQDSEQLKAEYQEPKTLAVGMAVLETFTGNEFIKPLFIFQHDTGLSFFNAKKGERAYIQHRFDFGDTAYRWASRTYTGVEQVIDEFMTEEPTSASAWRTTAKCTEDTTRVYTYSNVGGDAGSSVGVVGFFTNNAVTVRGYCDLRISKSAVDEGRVDVSDYLWICIAKKSSDKDELEAVTEKDIESYAGLQSIDKPTFDETTNTYVCHFDFGNTYEARKIEIDSDDDEELVGYVFLPYIPDDHMIEVTIPADEDDETSTETTEEVLNLKDGDLCFEGLVIASIEPSVEVSALPATIRVIESLPDISCFDFMKSVFYMNGAMPRVERDGETISAMYYNQLRDRVNDGEAVDWSDKLLSADRDYPLSIKFHNTNFAQNNYLEMSGSNREETEDDASEELDKYGDGYGTIKIDDDTLDDETSVFSSSFYPAYVQNLRYPLLKVGRTCKVWEGGGTLAEDVSPIYGIMVLRAIDPTFEDAKVIRPGLSDVNTAHIRMNIFSPFDDKQMMDDLFGYYQTILNNYYLIKEKFILNEIDLRDFDESMPVYLSKYNSYFAVSTIQRDKEGVSTVELVKLPRVKNEIGEIDTSYEVEILSAGYIEFETGYDDGTLNVYIKLTKDSDWEVYTGRRLEFGSSGIYAITADSKQVDGVVLRIYATYIGQYRFKYKDPDTGADKEIVRSEANAYFDGKDWSSGSVDGYHEIKGTSQEWHRVEIDIPIRNQYGDLVETKSWQSPIFVSKKEYADYGESDARFAVSDISMLVNFTLSLLRDYTSNLAPISYDIYVNGTFEVWNTTGYTLALPLGEDSSAKGYVSRFAYPYEAERMSGENYTLRLQIPNSVSYTLTKMIGFETVESRRLSVVLRTYYDDVRVVDGQTLTFGRGEFGQYHILKFIADLVDEDGTVVRKLREKVYWFVSTVDRSVITDDFGDEHEGDETVRVNDVAISGPSSIANYGKNEYSLSFTPTYADVGVSSVEVSINSQYLDVLDVTTAGFVLQAQSLPQDETGVTITVKVNLQDGTSFTRTKDISILIPTIAIVQLGVTTSRDGVFNATNGRGSARFYVVARPNNDNATVKSVTSSNSLFSASEISGQYFTLSVDGITQDETTTISVVAEYGGMQLSGTLDVKAEMKNMWAVDVLDAEGALIVDVNGMFYSENEWKASGVDNDDADGVAVSDGQHRFILAKKQFSGANGGKGTVVPEQFTAADAATALTDFSGKANTDAMIAALSSSAAHTIRGRADFPSGQQGYYGAAGEWQMVQDRRNLIKSLLAAIGADDLVTSVAGCEYLTSTQLDDDEEWYYHFGTDNTVYRIDKDRSEYIRALAELKQVESPVARGYMEITGEDTFTVANGTGAATFGISYGPSDVAVSEVSMTSSNSEVKLNVVSQTKFTLSVSGILVDTVTVVTVKARLNGLMTTVTRRITAIGETVVDYEKLDSEHTLILCKDYSLYTEDEWYSSGKTAADVEGIAVSDGTHRIIVAKVDADNGQRYYFGGRGVSIEGLPTGSSDYDGEGNTLKIMAAVTSSDGYFTSKPYSAAAVARGYSFPTGKQGHLGSSGEWNLVGTYYEKIDELLAIIGGDALVKTFSFTYWVSTGGGDNIKALCYHLYQSEGNVTARLESYCYRSRTSTVRPFRKF